ncbi:hypothetical protein [Streptomyces sp. NBC_00572]|uniref:hypothetical protein n=1 Tax=Streptomyces sp. NBC_00572 TaxID=2903664 RepID=UPI0022593209|nr:hypothetical protein [Streptomyces sp. NBC_00572]MCX4981497.1 hypothetical protein [Streptomyces sp. NBC_00572]
MRSQNDKKREYAGKIAAWITTEYEATQGPYYVTIVNAGNAPAYEIEVADSNSGRVLAKWAELPANQSFREPVAKGERGDWSPSSTTHTVRMRPADDGMVSGKFLIEDKSVDLKFRDALGRRWRIDKKGRISHLQSRWTITTKGHDSP